MSKPTSLISFSGRIALALVLLSGVFELHAHGAPGGPNDPPLRQTVDGNGVDLYAGRMVVSSPTISIGSGSNLLNYGIVFRGNHWRHGFIGGIYTPDASTLNSVTIYIGEHTAQFVKSSGVYSATQVTNGTLTQNPTTLAFTYTMTDGTVAVFNKVTSPLLSLGSQFEGYYALLDSVTLPSGERYSYRYQGIAICTQNPVYCTTVSRLGGIDSTRGYSLDVTYASNDGTADPGGSMRVTKVKLTNRISNTAAGMPELNLAYDASGIQFTDAALRVSRVNTTVASGVTSVRNPGSASDNLTVTYSGGKVSSINNNGLVTGYSYSTSGGNSITTINRPGGAQEVYTFSSPYRLISFKDGLNRTTNYTYDSLSRLETVTTPGGVVTSYAYDSRWNTTLTTVSGGGLSLSVAAEFDAACSNPKICNKPIWTRDASGQYTDYTYHPHGGVWTVTQPAPAAGQPRPRVEFTYEALEAWYKNTSGVMTASGVPMYVLTRTSTCRTQSSCVGLADELRTVIGYGTTAGGRNLWPIEITSQSGDGVYTTGVTKGYDLVGNEVSSDGPLAADMTMMRYDALRRPVGVISPDPDGGGVRPHLAMRIGYDTLGRISTKERGTVTGYTDTAWTNFLSQDLNTTTYDGAYRPIRETYAAGGVVEGVTQISYDTASRVECTAVRMNKAAFGSLPVSACSLGTAGLLGPDRITQIGYNAAGEVSGVTTALGVAGEQSTEGRAYTTDGLVSDLIDGKGNRTNFQYDGLGRSTYTYYPHPSTTGALGGTADYERLIYSGARLSQQRVRGPDGPTERFIGFSYDNLGRVTLKDVPDTTAGDVYYGYDNHGRVLSARFGSSSGPGNVYTYDGLGRLASKTTDGRTLGFQYGPTGLRSRLTYPDGFYVDYAYTSTGELDTITGSLGGVLARFTYDNLGRRIRLDRGAAGSSLPATVYGYNAASQLTSLQQNLSSPHSRGATFGYSPAGQITSSTLDNPGVYGWKGAFTTNRSYTIDGRNQVSAVGAVSLNYDARGNFTTGDANWSFLYDVENLLRTATSEANTVTLQYDPDGLIQQIDQSNGPSTKFLFDGGNLVAEFGINGVMLRRYVSIPGIDQPLVWYEGADTTDRRWFHTDERGSVVAVSDSNGAAITTVGYSPYGEMTISGYSRFRYTGQPYISELGLHYYKARFYSSPLGRFLSPDPIRYAAGPNLYAYVSGDPINRVDPWGLKDYPDIGWESNPTAPRLRDPCAVNFSACGYWGFVQTIGDHYSRLWSSLGGGGGEGPPQKEPQGPSLLEKVSDWYCSYIPDVSLNFGGEIQIFFFVVAIDVGFDVGISTHFQGHVTGFGAAGGGFGIGANALGGTGLGIGAQETGFSSGLAAFGSLGLMGPAGGGSLLFNDTGGSANIERLRPRSTWNGRGGAGLGGGAAVGLFGAGTLASKKGACGGEVESGQ